MKEYKKKRKAEKSFLRRKAKKINQYMKRYRARKKSIEKGIEFFYFKVS